MRYFAALIHIHRSRTESRLTGGWAFAAASREMAVELSRAMADRTLQEFAAAGFDSWTVRDVLEYPSATEAQERVSAMKKLAETT